MLGFRLLAPYFGYSIYVFGNLIGSIMLALFSGYILGGFLSKKVNSERFFKILVFAGLAYFGLVLLFYDFILGSFANFGFVFGVLISSLSIFFIPSLILACLSPYFLKTASLKNEDVGFTGGKIYAIGTMGSLLGIYLTSFWLIPNFGTGVSLFINFIIFFLLTCLILRKKFLIISIAVFVVFGSCYFAKNSLSKKDSRIIYVGDSAYNYLEVKDYEKFLALKTDKKSLFVQSVFYQDEEYKNKRKNVDIYDVFEVTPKLNNAKNVLLLGLGAGTVPYMYSNSHGLKITAVELDPKIIDLGFKFFHLGENKNLKIVNQDARYFMNENLDKFDLILVDLFSGMAEMPFYTDTKEFFQLIKNSLNKNGLLAINVFDPSLKEIIISPTRNTISSIFKNSYNLDLRFGSHVVVASENSVNFEKIFGQNKENQKTADYFLKNYKKIGFDNKETVFSDDNSPLESLTYRAISKDFLKLFRELD